MPLTPTEQNRQRENDGKGINKIGSNAMIHMNRGSADANGQAHKSFSMHNKRDQQNESNVSGQNNNG